METAPLNGNFKQLYWRARKDSDVVWHLLRMLASFGRHYLQLQWLRLGLRLRRRRLVAIALVEHMGDIVAGEPVSRYARAQFRRDTIVWVTRAPYAALVAAYPSVDRVLVVHCLSEWMLLRAMGVFDACIDLHIRERPCHVCRYPLNKHEGNPKIGLDNYYMFGNLLKVQCESAGIPTLVEGPRLAIPGHVVSSIDAVDLPSRFVAVHCASNEASRDWDAVKWAELARLIAGRLELRVVEVGLNPVIADSTPGYRSLCGSLSILETAEVIRRAALFIGVDSGPAHLANAVGTPGVILLGHYRAFAGYQPYAGAYMDGNSADLLHAGGPLRDMEVQRVFAAVEARVLGNNRGGNQAAGEGGACDAVMHN